MTMQDPQTAGRDTVTTMRRYDIITNYRCGCSIEEMERADDGEWIRFEDVEAQLAASDQARSVLQEKLDETARLAIGRQETIDVLLEANERLKDRIQTERDYSLRSFAEVSAELEQAEASLSVLREQVAKLTTEKSELKDLLAALYAFDRTSKPRKLDEALTWRENEDLMLARVKAATAESSTLQPIPSDQEREKP